jgi:putative Flp pilus-assembly TadE/G-like protein
MTSSARQLIIESSGIMTMLKRLARASNGAIATMTALLMFVLISFVGLGVELGFWYTVKRSMQGAADSAVIEAAASFASGKYVAHAKAVAGQNNWQDGVGGTIVAVNNPPQFGSHVGNTGAVEVVISRPQSPFLVWAVGYVANITIAAHAVALLPSSGPPCITALSTANNAIQINGNAVLDAVKCTVQTKGDLQFAGNHSVLDAAGLSTGSTPPSQCANSPSAQCNVPTGKVTQNGASDPFANRSFQTPPATPPAGSCKALGSTGKAFAQGCYLGGNIPGGSSFASGTFFRGATSISGGSVTFGAAGGGNVFYFDGGLSISGGTITFNPGIYYIEAGDFNMSGPSTLTGTGVTIVLTTNAAGATYANLSITGQANLNLTAPASGSTAGIAFFSDRNAPTTTTDQIAGQGNVTIDGVFYFPTGNFMVAGNGVSASPCTEVVALTIKDTGNGQFSNACDSVGIPGNVLAQLVE